MADLSRTRARRWLLPASGWDRDALNRALYRIGWRIGPHLGRRTRDVLAAAGGAIAARRGGRHVDQWRHNIELATGIAPDARLSSAGMRSYLRTFLEVLALPGWSAERTIRTVCLDPAAERILRDAAAGPGVVVALPHLANWDLAGAWACATGLPVSSVAEQLGDPEFRAFLAFREGLGMRIRSNLQPRLIEHLVADVREGRVVCLIADRDLLGTGVDVTWPNSGGGRPARLPAGPAVVARRTGAVLLAGACHYTPIGMRIELSAPIEHRDGRAGLVAMVQDCADFFAAAVAAHPADWHVLQPFFPER